MTLTKSQITEQIIERIGFTKIKSDALVESLIELMKKSLESGNDVLISNFGKLQVKDKKIRKGRNPATGETMELPARRVVTFKSAANLRDKINGKKN